jgi:hypothetical protein
VSDSEDISNAIGGLREVVQMLGESLVTILRSEDDRFLFKYGDRIFNVRHVSRAEFRKTGEQRGTVKIWFSSDAGLGSKPLIFKGKEGDYVWAFLGTAAEDAKGMLIL